MSTTSKMQSFKEFLLNPTIWILALAIFGVDLVQRGLAVFADSDVGIPHLQDALSIYFLTMSIAVLACSYFCDNFNSRKIILTATLLGAAGIAILPFTAWGYGLTFGAAAAFLKISPFAAALKLKDGKEALRVSPHAAMKNFSSALFILILGTVIASLGWITSSLILSGFFVLTGIMCYFYVPDDKIEGWKWSIFKELAKDAKFWMVMLYFFLMSGVFYVAVKGFYPALTDIGHSSKEALTLLAISFLTAGVLRWFVSWVGDQSIFNVNLRLPLMWLGTGAMASCILITPIAPYASLGLFTISSSVHTPNYWAYCKENWGARYIATIAALGFAAMYLGSGIMYGKWF